MPSKKPPLKPTGAANKSTPPARPKASQPANANSGIKADARWQRTKRYGWDSR